MRLALYEGAEVNLGVNNGPTCMLFYSFAKYIIFKMVTEGIPWCEADFLHSVGITAGEHHGGRGKIVYEEDSFDNVIREIDKFYAVRKAA